MEIVPILNLFCLQGPGTFKDNENMLFFNMSFVLFFPYTCSCTFCTNSFNCINIKKKKKQVRLTPCEKEKLGQKRSQLAFIVANHQGATKGIQFSSFVTVR